MLVPKGDSHIVVNFPIGDLKLQGAQVIANGIELIGGQSLHGQHEASVDSKGRISMAKALRQGFGDDAVVLKWDRHLKVMSPQFFERVVGSVMNRLAFSSGRSAGNFFDPKVQRDRRAFFGNKFELSFDGQGRLALPKSLRVAMNLVEDAIWVGCGEYVELWSLKDYEADCARWEESGGFELLFNDPAPPGNSPAPGTDGDGEPDGD